MLIKKEITAVEYRDTALALVFLCFLLWLFFASVWFLYLGMAILLLAMIMPKSMKYPAMVWLGFSHALGMVVSKIILGFTYFILVVPVGLVRRLMGKDSMRLKSWKNGEVSAFVTRNHHYDKDDLTNQF